MSKDIPLLHFELHDPPLQGASNGLGTVNRAEFAEDTAYVQLDGALGDFEGIGDVAVPPAAYEKAQNFYFPR